MSRIYNNGLLKLKKKNIYDRSSKQRYNFTLTLNLSTRLKAHKAVKQRFKGGEKIITVIMVLTKCSDQHLTCCHSVILKACPFQFDIKLCALFNYNPSLPCFFFNKNQLVDLTSRRCFYTAEVNVCAIQICDTAVLYDDKLDLCTGSDRTLPLLSLWHNICFC